MSAPGGSDGPTIGAGVLPEASPAVAVTDAPASAPRRPARIVVAGMLALLFLGLAAYCVRRGIVTDTWPAGVVMDRFSESPPLVAPGCSRARALVLL